MEIDYIRTSDGIVVKLTNDYVVNDKKLIDSFDREWKKVVGEYIIKSIKKKIPSTKTNERYELIDKSFTISGVPVSIKIEKGNEYIYYDDYECLYRFRPEYQHIASLYEVRFDISEEIYEEIEFELNLIAEVKSDLNKSAFEIEYYDDLCYGFNKDRGNRVLNNSLIKTEKINKILFPEILYQDLPCSIDGNIMYKILRAYIRKNIDNRYAKINSDYDFCFGVEKKIQLFEIEEYTIDINVTSKRKKPKYEKRYKTNRIEICFEMTPPSQNYKGYTPCVGVEGENYEDLEKNILKKCKEVLAIINEPLCDCPLCKGRGVVIENIFNQFKK